MSDVVNVIVTCTAAKRGSARAPSVADLEAAPRVDAWLEHVATAQQFVPARERYKGATWKAALELDAAVPGSRLYIISAGLGLIHAETEIPAYDATFSPGPADVARGAPDRGTALRTWWTELTKRSDWGKGTIDGLIQGGERTLLVASEAYLDAVHDDLRAAIESASDRLVVITSNADRYPWLPAGTPRFDARVQGRGRPLGGARQALNQLVARALVELSEDDLSIEALGAAARTLMDGQPDPERYDRSPMTDDEVIAWIEEQRTSDVNLSRTAALRRLRASGRACEQGRFRSLWERSIRSGAAQPEILDLAETTA